MNGVQAQVIIDGHPWSEFTLLSEAQLAGIRSRAQRAGRLVDPVVLLRNRASVAAVSPRWAHAILGRPFRGARADTWPAFLTLVYAIEAEPVPPDDPVEASLAAERLRVAADFSARQMEELDRRRDE